MFEYSINNFIILLSAIIFDIIFISSYENVILYNLRTVKLGYNGHKTYNILSVYVSKSVF